MPWAPSPRCSTPGCDLVVVDRGKCGIHKLTTRLKGYGPQWQAQRAQALARGAVCAIPSCEERSRLQRDHIVPRSMGGTDEESNLRWLCASHHARFGLRSSSRVAHA